MYSEVKTGKSVVISIVGSVLGFKGKDLPKRFYVWRPNFDTATYGTLAKEEE